MRVLMLGIGLLTAAIVIGALLVDEGEVVTIVTTAADGRDLETQAWIVDLDGSQYLRAASPNVAWLARLREHPRIEITRGGEDAPTVAVIASVIDDSSLRESVNRAMAAKYGSSDRMWGLVSDRKHALPIRLEPDRSRDEHSAQSSISAPHTAHGSSPNGGRP